MSSFTPIVPQRVLDIYLGLYNPTNLNEIEAVYTEVRNQLFAEHGPLTKQDRRILTTAGAAGAGKSTHLRKKVQTAKADGHNYIRIDIDDILSKFPTYQREVGHISEYFGMACDINNTNASSDSTHRRALRDTTLYWNLATKYIADRILNDCVERGLPVAFETSANNQHIAEFLANLRANGYQIEMDLCDAPLAIKLKESQSRFDRGEAYVSDGMIIAKTPNVLRNVDTYLQYADTFNVYWRDGAGRSLTHVTTSVPAQSYQAVNNAPAAEAFDMMHKEHGISIKQILSNHAQAFAARTQRRDIPQNSPRLAL